MSRSELKIVFILGPPGAGKGTICKYLDDSASLCGYKHLSVGDFLRKLCATDKLPDGVQFGDMSGEEVRDYVKQSKSLPASTILPLLQEELAAKRSEGVLAWIIDGFPRTVEAAEMFENQAAAPGMVILFDCPKHIAQARFTARKRSSTDDEELFVRRYDKYERYIEAIVERYADRLESVDTTEPVEKSSGQLAKLLKKAAEAKDRE